LKRQIPTQRWVVVIESCLPSPHCLVAQDVALSRPKRGFEFLWGHNYKQHFSKRGSPEGDSIRTPPWAQESEIIFKTRIPGRGFIRIPPGAQLLTVLLKRGSPEGRSMSLTLGEQITFLSSQSLRFTYILIFNIYSYY
jgi:hypothetical protein